MPESFQPFDLKITKLTGYQWDRSKPSHLIEQLLDEQGLPRYSIEPRVIIAFDKSSTSEMEFLINNRNIIINALLKIAYKPLKYSYWISKYDCWGSLFIIPEGQYIKGNEYYHHPIGIGIREVPRAEFERNILKEVAQRSSNRIHPNQNPKEHGKDGELLIDILKLKNGKQLPQLKLFLF